MCITLCNRFSRFRIIVRACRIQIQNLPVHNFFRRTNIADSSQKFFPIIAAPASFSRSSSIVKPFRIYSYVLCQAPVFLYFKHSSKLFLQVQRTGLRKTSLESTVFQILEWQASSLPFFLRYRLSLFSLTFCEQE